MEHLRAFWQSHRFELAIGLLAAALLVVIGLRTPSDVDEGFYALAAELVARGRVPYRDFFYPQAPYLPYFLAPFTFVLGSRFVIHRVVLALLAGSAAGVIAWGVRRTTDSRIAAAGAAALYTLHDLTWQWGPSIRPYGLCALLGTVALVLVGSPRRPSLRACLLAGALAGVMVGARLLLAPVAVAVVVAAWLRESELPALRAVAVGLILRAVVWAPYGAQAHVARWAAPATLLVLLLGRRPLARALRGASAAGGVALALLPAALLYRLDPYAFVFGNMTFHSNRVVEAIGGADAPWWAQRETYVHGLYGIVPMNHLSPVGTEFMLLATFAAAGLLLGRARALVGPLLAAWSVVIAGLVPMPAHEHYFTLLVPFLALAAGISLGSLLEHLPTVTQRLALPFALVAVTVTVGRPSFEKHWVRGIMGDWDFRAFRPAVVDFGAQRVREVAATHPGPVLPLWPGSALGLAHRILAGTENHFGRVAPLPPEEPDAATRLRILTSTDITARIVDRQPAVVTVDRESEHEGTERLRALLGACGYRLDAEVEGLVQVWGRDVPATHECRP